MSNLSDYTNSLFKLSPPGLIFTGESDTNIYKLYSALSEELLRLEQKANDLVSEANPITMSDATTSRRLEVGLPDSCKGEPLTFQEKRNEVIAKWRATGYQTREYYLSVALAYGYQIKVYDKAYPSFKIGTTPINTIGFGDAWLLSWDVYYVGNDIAFFRGDMSLSEESLEVPITIPLDCILEKIKPAHTSIIYHPVSQSTFDTLV